MLVTNELIQKKLFNEINEKEFAILLKLLNQIKSKKDIIKVNDDELEALMKGENGNGIGRDNTTQALTSLAEKGYISRKQTKDENGRFGKNEIQIVSNLITEYP